jgi:hypothetical protein
MNLFPLRSKYSPQHPVLKHPQSSSLSVRPSFTSIQKVKMKSCKHHVMMYCGSGGIAPLILNLDTRWRGLVSFAPWKLYTQGKRPQYALYRRSDGPQGQSERGGEEKFLPYPYKTRAGIAQSVYWLATGWTIGWPGFDSLQGLRIFSLNHCVQTGSGAHPASYPMDNKATFPGSKVAGAWSWPLTSI